jgi:hypothetical protein
MRELEVVGYYIVIVSVMMRWMMKFWTDVEGNKLTFKEFMARWKKGIEGITPLQQSKSSLMGSVIVLVGIFWGMVVTFFAQIWWLFVILLGSLIVSLTALLGTYQKYSSFKKIDNLIKDIKEDEENV